MSHYISLLVRTCITHVLPGQPISPVWWWLSTCCRRSEPVSTLEGATVRRPSAAPSRPRLPPASETAKASHALRDGVHNRSLLRRRQSWRSELQMCASRLLTRSTIATAHFFWTGLGRGPSRLCHSAVRLDQTGNGGLDLRKRQPSASCGTMQERSVSTCSPCDNGQLCPIP
jgi:hypothetical protein